MEKTWRRKGRWEDATSSVPVESWTAGWSVARTLSGLSGWKCGNVDMVGIVGGGQLGSGERPEARLVFRTKLRGQPMNLPSFGGMETDLVLSNNVSSVSSGVDSGGAVPVSGLHYCALSLALFGLYPVLRLVMMIRCNCTL